MQIVRNGWRRASCVGQGGLTSPQKMAFCQNIVGPWVGRILAVLGQSALGDVFELSVSALGKWRCTGMLVGEGVRSVGL
jgi:hypothetical protein